MKLNRLLILYLLMIQACGLPDRTTRGFYQISGEELEDRIRGGLPGEIMGNLNGLPHEFRYFNDHGRVHYLFLLINRDRTQRWLSDPENPHRGRHIDGYYYSFLEVE